MAKGAVAAVVAVVVTMLAVVAGGPSGTVSASPAWYSTFHALTPSRLADTRPGYTTIDDEYQGVGPIDLRSGPWFVKIAGRGGVPSRGVGAVAVNVTVTGSTAPGFLVVSPNGSGDPAHPTAGASTLNWAAGGTVANMTIVPINTAGSIAIAPFASTDIVVDVLGWFPAGRNITGLSPARLLDTRPASPTTDGQFAGVGALGPHATLDLQVLGRGGVPASGVGSVVLNLTVDGPSAPSFLTVYPTGSPQPNSSNLNFVAGQTVANSTIVPVGPDGRVSITNYAGDAHVIVDVDAWFPPDARFTALTPARLMDSRPGSPTIDGDDSGGGRRGPGSRTDLLVIGRGGVPATGVGAVAVNVTVDGPSAPSFLTVFPSNATEPNSSNLNFVAGQTVANTTIVPVGPDGRISIANYDGTTDLIVDVLGWFPTFADLALPTRVSLGTGGAQATGFSDSPSISADGRYVAFVSTAADLGGNADGDDPDVFVRDTVSGTTTIVSETDRTSGPATSPSISADGHTVAFEAFDAPVPVNGVPPSSLYVVHLDALSSEIRQFSVAQVNPLYGVSISADGRYVAFGSTAWLRTGTRPGTGPWVWVLDTVTTDYRLASARPDGSPASGLSENPVIADDGRSVVYASDDAQLVAGSAAGQHLIRTSLVDGTNVDVTAGAIADCATIGDVVVRGAPSYDLSSDGRYVAYTGRAVGPADGHACVRDMLTGSTVLASTTSDGQTLTTTSYLIFPPAGISISGDGRSVAFLSRAPVVPFRALASHDVVLVKDLDDGVLAEVSGAGASFGNGTAREPVLAADGRTVAYASTSTDLVAGDTNGASDVFVIGRG